MARFMVGDFVTVRSDLVYNRVYKMDDGKTDSFVSGMGYMRGKRVKISAITSGKYRIEGAGYNWTDEMFEEYYGSDRDSWAAAAAPDLALLF